MKIKLTDTGMNPVIKDPGNWNDVFDMLEKYGHEYTHAAVSIKDDENNDVIIFEAHRNIGNGTWNCSYTFA